MIKVKVIKKFYDKVDKKIREVDSEFEASEKRVQELTGYVEVIKEAKKTGKE